MTENEIENKVQKQESLDAILFAEWFTTATANPEKWSIDLTPRYTRYDADLTNKKTGKKYKIEYKHLNSNYTEWNNWVLNYEKYNQADYYWLHYDDGYVVLATNDQLTRFLEDYGENATILHRQLKSQVDPKSPMIKQLQFNVPHTEAGNYFSLYKDGKLVINE
jgi:hypothetical protein